MLNALLKRIMNDQNLIREPKITKSAKKGIAHKIIKMVLKQEGEFAEVKLGIKREAKHVARALGRVIKNSYADKLEYLGRDDKKNAVYLKKK